jgi:hypothetical protein
MAELEWRKGILTSLQDRDPCKDPRDVREVSRLIRDAAKPSDLNGNTIEAVYAALMDYLGATPKSEDTSGQKRVAKRTHRSKKSLKRSIYARTQDLYKNDTRLLAKHVRMGSDLMEPVVQTLDREDVQHLYGALWGTKAPTRLGDPTEEPLIGLDSFEPITAAEVRKRLSRIKMSAAPGLDGIKKARLIGTNKTRMLAGVFNLILASGPLPDSWRHNRTTLIPKEGKDYSQAANYRPITIGSLLSRLFWGIIDQRLREVVKISPRQKGFVAEAGCFANTQLLDEIISRMKSSDGGVGKQLDISKAFDTIPHLAIGHALKRKGLPGPIVELVKSSYVGIHTCIAHQKGGIDITLQRGVKQGDPLSPLIFNLVMEPLLEDLEHMPGYIITGSANISCLAFADDLFLFASDTDKAQDLLDCTVNYLGAHGMTISASKSYAFQVVPTKDSWHLADPGMERLGERIPPVKADQYLTYLGEEIFRLVGHISLRPAGRPNANGQEGAKA